MSKISAFSNNRFPQKSFENSINIEDLIRENQQLKISVEQLIEQNTQLTQIIQELSNQHQTTNENIPNINQEEIEALAHQVIELQQQLQIQKQSKQQPNMHQDGDAQQTIKIIEELSTEFQSMQEHYQVEIQKLQTELNAQKGQCKVILDTSEERFSKTIQEYHGLLDKLKKKDQLITELENRLAQTSHASKKELKISTTIEELRVTLQRQIEEKQRIIKAYEELIKNLKTKLIEK